MNDIEILEEMLENYIKLW